MPLTRKRFLGFAGRGAIGAATYSTFGFLDRMVAASGSAGEPCTPPPTGKFAYKGRAVAVSGHIKEYGKVSEQAVAVLDAENGGHHEARVEGFAFHGVAFVDSAYSLVTGNPDCRTDPASPASKPVFRTTVSSTVTGLDVDAVVRADMIVANLESQQPPVPGGELDMLPIGYFTNLRIRNHRIDLHPPGLRREGLSGEAAREAERGDYLATLMTIGTWSKIDKPLQAEVAEHARPDPSTANARRCQVAEHGYPQLGGASYQASIFSDRSILRAVKDVPGVTACRGGLIHVADLGDIYLGTYVVEKDLRTLTMLRVVLKSPPSGEMSFASVQGDGRPR